VASSSSDTADHPYIWSRRTFIALALATGAAALGGCTSSQDDDRSPDGEFSFDESTPVGELIPVDRRAGAPDVRGELLDGTDFGPEDYQSTVLVLNFWGSWCAPCRVETPEFQQVYADIGNQGVAFLGVAVKDQRQLAQAFYDDFGITYPSLFDPSGEVALAFRDFPANVVPTTILIDTENRVAATYVAVVPEADLRRALEKLLTER
jgi:peroxiredoxin